MIIGVMELFEFLLLFPVFETQLMQRYYPSVRLSATIRLIIVGYALLLYITKKRKISAITMCFAIIQGYIFTVSYINGRHAADLVQPLLSMFIVPLLFDIYSDKMDIFLRNLVIYCKVLVYGNAVSMVLFRNGIITLINPPYAPTPMWLIGVSNSLVFWLYPIIVILLVDYFINKNVKSLIAAVLAGLMNFFSLSTTGLVGTVILFAILFLPKLRVVVTPIRIGVVGIIFFFLIIVIGNSSFLEPLIVGILGKDMTFSNRLIIWQNAIEAIILNPIFGYGLLTRDNLIMILGRLPSGMIGEAAIHCHSEYLQIFFRYGLIGGAFWAVLLFLALIKCSRKKSDVSLAFGVGLAIVMIMGITEVFAYPLFYLLVVGAISFNCFDKLCKNSSETAEE